MIAVCAEGWTGSDVGKVLARLSDYESENRVLARGIAALQKVASGEPVTDDERDAALAARALAAAISLRTGGH